MEYLGLFCLGIFVCAIATVGLALIKDLTDWRQVLIVTLPAILSGAAMVFVDRFKYSPALGCYPLGLVVSLVWAYIGVAVQNIKSDERSRQWLGYCHAGSAVIVTITSAILVSIPAIEQVAAESALPAEARVQELLDAKSKAYAQQSTKAGAPAASAQNASQSASGASAPASTPSHQSSASGP